MRTVLLIDDDDFCRGPAAELLRRADWKVIEAANGEAGIELALTHRPDVVLCDLMMPRGNGFSVCRSIRARPEMAGTRVVVLTGRDYAADREAAQRAGADDYLVKPLNFSDLTAALERVASKGANGRQRRAPDFRAGEEPSGACLRFWGVRGSIPSPGRGTVGYGGNTSCVELRADGQLIVLDAGSGIRALGNSLNAEFGRAPIDLTLLISHTHWDHIQGFPFFLPAYDAKNRLHVLGYEGAADGLAGTLAGQMESPYFPIALKQMPGNIIIEELKDMQFEIGPVKVEACFSNHPGVCVGYRLHTSGGSIVYLPDNESTREPAPGSAESETVPRMIEQQLAQFIEGADVLICDSQYTREEYATHVGWGHGCVDDVVHFAIAGQVKRLVLFHHDPSHDDAFIDGMLAHARGLAEQGGGTLQVDAAREQEEIVLAPCALAGSR